ncbi:MAG: hypothetical protein AB7I18_05010 [Candidatus Berkiella sp.]
MAAVPQAKRKFMIAFALVGFYLCTSTWLSALLLLVGAFNYLSIIFETMQQLPPLPAPSCAQASPSVPSRILRFAASTQGQNQEQKIRFVIQQDSQKTTTSQPSSKAITNTPNSARRVKI